MSKRDLLESDTALLQHQIGNRAVQQAIVQRQVAAGFNPLDPRVMGAAAKAAIEASEKPVRDWLAANTNRLHALTIDELVAHVRRNVVEAGRLSNVEIQNLVREWAVANSITIPEIVTPGAGAGISVQIPDTVKKAFSIPLDGVDVVPLPGGRLNISAKGLTAKLLSGNINVGWTGSLGIDFPIEGFQLAGKLDKENWEVALSVPGESSVPDLSKLADVFRKAEIGMRGMLEATPQFVKLDNITRVTKAVSPHVGPIKEAVEALVKTAKAPRASAGLKIEGPVSGSGGSSAGGITVTATVTIRF